MRISLANVMAKFSVVNFKAMVMHNFWLKLVAFIMAIITWLYVKGEVSQLMQGIRI